VVARYAAIALALLVAWTFIDRQATRDRAEERRALQSRAAELTARAMAPGSPLACLDASAGEVVEAVCESALFASPESVAAALSYVIARLTLLSDGSDFANRGDATYDTILKDLRRAAEADRFGLVSYVLATRDNCTPESCGAYELLNDASRVRANLRDAVFDRYVSIHLAAWQTAAAGKPASPEKPGPATSGNSNWNYPSAASIPPVSIMTNEPSGPVTPPATVTPPPVAAATANTAPEANPPTPPRRPPSAPVRRSQNPGAPTPLTPQPPPSPAAATAGAPPRVQ
jgi:hypothetical protein